MEYFLTLPDRATWEAFGWVPEEIDASIQRGPKGQTAKVIGDNYFLHEDGTKEPREGFLVNIEGPLEEGMEQYALAERPKNPKSVFLGA